MAKVNFNPRSREGSDGMTAGYGMQAAISIHAPARGATKDTAETCSRQSISIHAPARGATATASVGFARFVNFNPRSREGSDVLPSARPP